MINKQLVGITVATLHAYLVNNGWVYDNNFKNKNMMVFESKVKQKRIAFPSSASFEDFYEKIHSTIDYLSAFEQRELSDIIRDITTIFYDRIEFRIKSLYTEDGKLPLPYAVECLEGLKELILYSACAEQKASPVCSRPSGMAYTLLDNFKMGQTDIGSFIINVDTKVFDEVNDLDQQVIPSIAGVLNPPAVHKVVERVKTAITQIDEALESKTRLSDLAVNAFEKGITANMCEALLKLKPNYEDAEVITTIRYSPVLTRTAKEEKRISLNNQHFYILDELSKIYRNKVLYKDVILKGVITAISKKEQAEITENSVRLRAEYEGKEHTIFIELSESDFKKACDAIKEGQYVEISGELDMSNRIWILRDIKDFKLNVLPNDNT